jgi:hypothetical protein
MVSHIDDDHIAGIVDLLSWLKDHQDDEEQLPVNVLELWHNPRDGRRPKPPVGGPTPTPFTQGMGPKILDPNRGAATINGQ